MRTRTLLLTTSKPKKPVGRKVTQFDFKEADGNNDSNYLYYKEYCKLYYANIILTGRVSPCLLCSCRTSSMRKKSSNLRCSELR